MIAHFFFAVFHTLRHALEGDLKSSDGCLPSHPSSFSFHAVARRTPTLLQHSSRRHRNDQRCQSSSTWFPCVRVSRLQGLAFTSHACVMTSCVVSQKRCNDERTTLCIRFFFCAPRKLHRRKNSVSAHVKTVTRPVKAKPKNGR